MPPRAARLDPRDAYCSRNPPPPHHPYHAMRRAARAAAPPSASHRLPTPARRYSRCHRGSRETRPLLPIPHPCPARPPSLSSGKRATRSRLLQSARRGRESSTLTPRRVARRRGPPLSGSLCLPIQHALEQHHFCAQPHTHPMSMSMYQYTPNHLHSVFLPSFTWS